MLHLKLKYLSIVLLWLSFCRCNTVEERPDKDSLPPIANDSGAGRSNTLSSSMPLSEEVITDGQYSSEKLQYIRENFTRINSVSAWSRIDSLDLEESAEGGIAKYYYTKNGLEKMVSHNFGEMGQVLTEYYLLDGKLSFVFERNEQYNRPFYNNTPTADDKEVFDPAKSTIITSRNYFEKDTLLCQINSDSSIKMCRAYLLKTQKRIHEEFTDLIKQAPR